jgi:hypothetical protein
MTAGSSALLNQPLQSHYLHHASPHGTFLAIELVKLPIGVLTLAGLCSALALSANHKHLALVSATAINYVQSMSTVLAEPTTVFADLSSNPYRINILAYPPPGHSVDQTGKADASQALANAVNAANKATSHGLITLLVFALSILLFVTGWLAPEVTGLLAAALLVAFKVLKPDQAVQGFGSPA